MPISMSRKGLICRLTWAGCMIIIPSWSPGGALFYRPNIIQKKPFSKPTADEALTFDTMQVPRDPLRGAVPDVTNMLYWQPAQQNQGLREYMELQRDLWHKRFRQICAAMEDGVDRRVVFLYDSLKQTQQGWNLGAFFHEENIILTRWTSARCRWLK